MLSEIYIEALLVDEVKADQVWEAWIVDLKSNCPPIAQLPGMERS